MRRKNLINVLAVVSMVSLILTSCGVGADDGNTTEQIKDNLTVVEQTDNKTVYNFDRLGDGSDAFILEVESANSNSTVRVLIEDEVIVEDSVEFDKVAQIYTAENDIYMEVSQLNEDNSEYVFYESETPTDTDAFKFTTTEDYDKVEKMNYGKRVKIEEVEITEIEGYENYEGEYEKAVKVTYLDLGEGEEKPEDKTTEVTATATEPTTSTSTSTVAPSTEISTEVTTEEVKPVTPPPTTTTSTPTTEATTEEIKKCEHNWVEVMEYEYEAEYDEHICLYCGWSTTESVSAIINHCTECGGTYTHEELVHLLESGDDMYYHLLGRPRGASYTTKTHYKEIPIPTGRFYCNNCYIVKTE
ncbi:MAG: hypothetical protein E7257_06970 [Lachnospiraceae bacterium]|nr:hypothetical protein [Lachnospiraceae bacterium]